MKGPGKPQVRPDGQPGFILSTHVQDPLGFYRLIEDPADDGMARSLPMSAITAVKLEQSCTASTEAPHQPFTRGKRGLEAL